MKELAYAYLRDAYAPGHVRRLQQSRKDLASKVASWDKEISRLASLLDDLDAFLGSGDTYSALAIFLEGEREQCYHQLRHAQAKRATDEGKLAEVDRQLERAEWARRLLSHEHED